MTLHAMPVMLGVLAILAIAYRYYSAFLAAKVAALDDDRVTPAHRFEDGQNFDPTNRWVLFGHHFAAISGAGPLIGPVLAIQFGYLPGLVWLVIGVCLAGAVQDMMVLAASTRHNGLSLAGLARTEIGRPAGLAAAFAILYIVIIALAGLGIVVVKALGGEEVPMKAGTVLVYPPAAMIEKTIYLNRPAVYPIPPGATYRFGDGPGQSMIFNESFKLTVPFKSTLKTDKTGEGFVLPKDAKRLVPGSSWGTFTIACTIPIALLVGWYMYRIRKGKILEASIFGAGAVLAATVAGAWIPGVRARALLFALAKRGDLCARGVWICRGRAASLVVALSARLPVNLPQDWHDFAIGRRSPHCQSKAQGAGDQPLFRRRGRTQSGWSDFSLRFYLHHVRGDLRLSCLGIVGDDSQDGGQGE